MDVDDFASEIEMAEREAVIAARRRATAAHEAAEQAARAAALKRGFSECLNCGRRHFDGSRFCDADCRDDYQRRRRANLIGGTHHPHPEIPHAQDQPPGV